MYLVAGLGNPGKDYANTRHNVGFMAVDLFSIKNGIKVNKIKHKALIGEGMIEGKKVILAKPQTFMNLSGESIREIVEYYKIPIENLIVIYDDIDLPTGRIRIRKKGSAGTHNGMRNIIYHLQDENFPRIRIGVGKPSGDLVDYVLGEFSKEEGAIIQSALKNVVDAVEVIISQGIESAMNKYNGVEAK
ncbi:MAG: aminoacyl-tRNA hydrolase [Clostridiaceae bacterium]|nr:aminoacyl-tRNA hydrolase [Clostridiaceae bacterium]